jgi:nitrate/TMAO reductase-like tetraheme cytochrome c subunit
MTGRNSCTATLLLSCIAITAGMALPVTARGTDSCISCHADTVKMRNLGYPHFAVTAEEVHRQSGMTADCSDCHLGNPGETDRDKAHQGMGRLLIVRKKGLRAETADRKLPLEVTGDPMTRIKHRVEKNGTASVDTSVAMVLYQDKRRNTLSQDFSVMEKTCGRCHSGEVAEFRTSAMGRNGKQSQYNAWNNTARGPHNCGVWFDGNYERIAANTAVPFSADASALNQRSCNQCHVGCLDCHYDPQPKDSTDLRKGMHTFNRTPRPESCYGGGRGTYCHAGPEDRRRGAGYFGGSYSHPEGMEPDVHKKAGIGCLDCHASSKSDPKLGHGTVRRQATCDGCHTAVVESHRKSAHRNLSCEACHIRQVAGYQGTFWGPGIQAGAATPFFKYKEYYGIMEEPILIRDQKGRWIPVKPFPMAVLNQKGGPDLKPGVHWRWPKELPDPERTDDAWGYVGIVGGLPENNRAILWIQMDKMSHKYGKSRACDSCHGLAGGEQVQRVPWEFSDAGALPFDGSHTVVAGRNGLSIRNIRATGSIEPTEGQKISSFAPWQYLPDAWNIPGNFALPELKNKTDYARMLGNAAEARRAGITHTAK